MSKVKNYYWDEAEKFVDGVVAKIKSNMITLEQGAKEIKDNKDNYSLELVGIEYEDQIDEYLYYATKGE
jgi:hypothetical protein